MSSYWKYNGKVSLINLQVGNAKTDFKPAHQIVTATHYVLKRHTSAPCKAPPTKKLSLKESNVNGERPSRFGSEGSMLPVRKNNKFSLGLNIRPAPIIPHSTIKRAESV